MDWSGGFWERRYSAEPVLDDTALVGRLRYVLAHGVKEGLHGVKEGLVDRSVEWPGLTCLPRLLGRARRLFRWLHWTKRWGGRRSEDMVTGEERFAEEWAEPVALEVAPLPCWEGSEEKESQREVRALLWEVHRKGKGLPLTCELGRCPLVLVRLESSDTFPGAPSTTVMRARASSLMPINQPVQISINKRAR